MSTRPAPAPEPPFLKSAGIRSSTSSFKIKSSPHSGPEPAFQCQLPTDKCSNFNALQLTLFRKIKIKFFWILLDWRKKVARWDELYY